MKKIGIITICDNNNYGNRLQNYATQEIIKEMGFEAETIVNIVEPELDPNFNLEAEKQSKLNFPKQFKLRKTLKKIRLKTWTIINKKRIQKDKLYRSDNFKNFTAENIKESGFYISENSIPNDLDGKYDYFITGSDQIWNPNYRYGGKIDFLTFAKKYKRIALSPSFGISTIPLEYEERYRNWLSEMEYLSIREESGLKIIKNLTGRNAELLIDPTLMFSKEKWLTISKKITDKPENYILTYFLGSDSNEARSAVEKVAKENNLEIINLLDLKQSEIYSAGPGEFLDLINCSSLVCTNSYHGTIFSILFGKPFIVFDRIENNKIVMSSRINTLLKKLNLEKRKSNIIYNTDMKDLFNSDYVHAKDIIESERLKVYKYLKKALNNKQE